MEALESLLSSDPSLRNPEMKLGLMRLASETHVRLSNGSPASTDFIQRAFRLLSRITGARHADIRMACLLDISNFFFINGLCHESLRALSVAEPLASRLSDKEWLRKTGNFMGIVHADMGNTAEAVICYARALELARTLRSITGEFSGLINLGVALNYGSLYREAIPCLQRAVDVSRSSSQLSRLEPFALTNLAQSHFYLEEFDQAFRVINESIEKSTAPNDAFEATSRVIREYTFVQVALELGEFERARASLERCQRFACIGGTLRGKQMAQITSALYEAYVGDVYKATEELEGLLRALDASPTIRLTALKALITAYEHAGNVERAWRCIEELIAHMRAEREKGFLAIRTASTFAALASREFEARDLSAFTRKEAVLRARVAEQALVNAHVEILERFAVTADIKEESSGAHGYRVGKLSALLAMRLNWSASECLALERAARLHDIGKLAIPDRILLSGQELSNGERNLVSVHALVGADMLSKSDIPQLKLAADIAKYHHERWDGAGYPTGLCGACIPKCARIVALADVFDALTHGRPYAKPWTFEQAIAQLESGCGTHFDPDLAPIFVELLREVKARYPDLDGFLEAESYKSVFQQARVRIRNTIVAADPRPRAT